MSHATSHPTYHTTITDDGKWLHAQGENFLFAYLPKNMNWLTKFAVWFAFEEALKVPAEIKKAMEKTSGENVVDGLYLEDPKAVIKAINSVDGMAETSVINGNRKGRGTAVEIALDFFELVLGNMGGDLTPIRAYLVDSLIEMQAQAKNSQSESFGTVIGFISLMPRLNIPITTFVYIYSSAETKEWFVEVKCPPLGVAETKCTYEYDYKYTSATFNYTKL